MCPEHRWLNDRRHSRTHRAGRSDNGAVHGKDTGPRPVVFLFYLFNSILFFNKSVSEKFGCSLTMSLSFFRIYASWFLPPFCR